MAAQKLSEPLIPKLNIQKRGLRTIGSAGFSEALNKEPAVPTSNLTFSSASSLVEPKKRFRLPKIVLQDKKCANFDTRSCIETASHIPQNDVEIHEQELQCCPPCNPQDGRGPKYVVDRTDWAPMLKAEPGDLACFLAGCPPGVTDCERHHSERTSLKPEETSKNPRQRVDFEVSTEEPAQARSRLAVHDARPSIDRRDRDITKPQPGPLTYPLSKSRNPSQTYVNTVVRPSSRVHGTLPVTSPQFSEHDSSVTSGSDAFPHAATSTELREAKKHSLSTSVVTNFSLGGRKLKTKYAIAREAIRQRRSETRSQDSIEMPVSPYLESDRYGRSGSISYDRQEPHCKSKSMSPSFISQPSQSEFGQLLESNAVRNSSGTSTVALVMDIEDNGSNYTNDLQELTSKGRLRSTKDESRSGHPRKFPTSHQVITDDPAPREASKQDFESGIILPSSRSVIDRLPNPSSLHSSMEKGPTSKEGQPISWPPKPPSLLPSIFKGSPVTHGLLKPSVSESLPAKNRLSLSPALLPTPTGYSINKPDNPKRIEVLKIKYDLDKEEFNTGDVDHTPEEVPKADLECDEAPSTTCTEIAPTDVERWTAPDQLKVNRDQVAKASVDCLTNNKGRDFTSIVRAQVQTTEVKMAQGNKKEKSRNALMTDKSLSLYPNMKPVKASRGSKTFAIDNMGLSKEKMLSSSVDGPVGLAKISHTEPCLSPVKSLHTILNPTAQNDPTPALESKMQDPPPHDGCHNSSSVEKSLNAAYWGFVPVIKEAVQGVVEVAVRNAVNEANLSTKAMKGDIALKSPQPNLNVSKEIDTALEQSSMGIAPPISPRGFELTVVTAVPISRIDSTTASHGDDHSASAQKKIPNLDDFLPEEDIVSKDHENEGSQTGRKQSSNGSNTAYDRLETVPLGDAGSLAEDKRRYMFPASWKMDKGPADTPIPARRSSKNQATRPQSKTPLFAEAILSHKTSEAQPIDRNIKTNLGLQLTSVAPLELASRERKVGDEEVTPLPIEHEGQGNQGSRLSRANNTVHWLKELLSNNGPYEPQFTSFPLRDPRETEKARLKPTLKVGKGSERIERGRLKAPPAVAAVTRPSTAAAISDKKAEASEAFAQTINDLEALMNEALLIARQATDNQCVPDILSTTAKVLKTGREKSEEELRAYNLSRTQQARNSVLSIHESASGISDSDTSDMTEDSSYRRPCPIIYRPPAGRVMTIKETMPEVRNPSERPPVSRWSLPCQPKSRLYSNPLPLEDTDGDRYKIKAADPRSMPLECKINDPRKKIVSAPFEARNTASVGVSRPPSKCNSDNDIGYSGSDTFDPPQFRTLEFTRSRAVTFKTQSSGRSPRRLSPVKTDPLDAEPEFRGPGETALEISGAPSGPLPYFTPEGMSPKRCDQQHSEEDYQTVKAKLASRSVPSKREVRDYIVEHRHPPIQARESSLNLRRNGERNPEKPKTLSEQTEATGKTGLTYNWQSIGQSNIEPCSKILTRLPTPRAGNEQPIYTPSYDGSNMSHELDFNTGYGVRQRGGGEVTIKNKMAYKLCDNDDRNLPPKTRDGPKKAQALDLRGKTHLSLEEHHLKGFSLARSHKKKTIARDWSPARKRFVAFVSCLSTSLVGLLVGIYAGETPSIQYYIVDLHHYTVLGNVFFFIGLAIPTFFFWPLPLLHGRKPYILGAMSLAMPLLFPQALAVGEVRSPYIATWRVALILPRALMGFCLGFANMNFKSMLTDVFGASLQSTHPHQEHADEFDVRRHGGGMGIWLGLWTWSALGSIGVGFMIGALIIDQLSPATGFYISIAIIAFVMLMNVVVPETRRGAFRKSVAEVIKPDGTVSRRLARGEVKMHMVQSGPKKWTEEFHYGVVLSLKMLRQPGFLVMAVYVAWLYGQMVLIILLLGALMSRDYKLVASAVAASATSIPLGALLAIPFQKASIFSRARSRAPVSDDATTSHKKVHWSSHMVRRSIFILVLPFAAMGFTLSSSGPPIPWIVPILFAGLVGFLTNLAMAECHGILMETFDTSDLQPGMTGRARGSAGNKKEAKRTNYSSFPRVQSAFAITQGLGYLIASAASGVGGSLTRHIGAQDATGVVAGILLVLSLMLLGVLVRFTTVQIVPDSRVEEMELYHQARRMSRLRRESGIQEEEPFRPLIIGNPHHHTRRMCLLELGGLSRFSEIRIKNRLVDSNSLEAKHPNRAAFENFEKHIKQEEDILLFHGHRIPSRHSSRDSISDGPEQGPLGGFREMRGSGQGRGNRGSRKPTGWKRVAGEGE